MERTFLNHHCSFHKSQNSLGLMFYVSLSEFNSMGTRANYVLLFDGLLLKKNIFILLVTKKYTIDELHSLVVN